MHTYAAGFLVITYRACSEIIVIMHMRHRVTDTTQPLLHQLGVFLIQSSAAVPIIRMARNSQVLWAHHQGIDELPSMSPPTRSHWGHSKVRQPGIYESSHCKHVKCPFSILLLRGAREHTITLAIYSRFILVELLVETPRPSIWGPEEHHPGKAPFFR